MTAEPILDFEKDRAYGDSLSESFDIASKVFTRHGTDDRAYNMLVFLKGESGRRASSRVVSLRYEPSLHALVYYDYQGISLTVLHMDCEIDAKP